MTNFFRDLMSGDESGVDSVVFGGMLALITHLGVGGYAVASHPDPLIIGAFVAGCVSITGVIGGAKRVRDGIAPVPKV